MAIFNWDDSYRTGIGIVDEQHRGLVDLINDLDGAISGSGNAHEAEAVLGRLKRYALEHFATEERLMLAAGPRLAAHYTAHKAQHDHFVASVQLLTRDAAATSGALGLSLLDFLVKWLLVHILGQDKEMGRLLSGESGGRDSAGGSDELAQLHRLLDSTVAERNLLGALHESEVRFRLLADSVPILVWLWEEGTGRSFFNRRWNEFTGMGDEQLLGSGWEAAVHGEDIEAYHAAMASARERRAQLRHEYRLRNARGSYRWMLETAVPRFNGHELAGYVGASVDISERKAAEIILEQARERLEALVQLRTAELRAVNARLEEDKEEQRRLIAQLEEAHGQLLQSEKMASIGQLAAGVAHEINNPVGYVISNLGTLQRYVADLLRLIDFCGARVETLRGEGVTFSGLEELKREIDFDYLRSDLTSLMEETVEGARRVKQIVQDLKEFSHVDEGEWQQADINKGLESTLNVVWNELKYKAEVVRDFGELPLVECLPGQLNQVFLNLLVNAAQAIEQRGTITVRTRHVPPALVIQISDTGCGIPEQIRGRIFDPFFTTKQVGSGTGLGLSIAYGIVQKHGGCIEVRSEVGHGTTFTITMPERRG